MKFKIEWKYKLKGNQSVTFVSDWLGKELAMQTGEEIERSGKNAGLVFIDEMDSSWTLKEMKKLCAELEEEPHDITIYFDGGYDKNTNEAGIGAVIYYHQGNKEFRIRANEKIAGMGTNNEGEYAALLFALNLLDEIGAHHLPCIIKGDSQVVIKQLEGDWPCYEENLNRWLDRIEDKIKKLGIKPIYHYLSRKENKEADKLATQALEGKIVHSKTQIN